MSGWYLAALLLIHVFSRLVANQLHRSTPVARIAATPRPGGELARQALTGPFEGFEAVLTEIALPPGQPVPTNRAHRHTGFVVGYVLEGQLRFAINNEPERVVPAGSTFFEPIGALHSANGATPGAPVRFLAFLVVPKGSPVVVPA